MLEAIGTFINGAELECASLRDYQRYSPGRGPDPRVKEGYGTLVAAYGAGLPVSFGTPVDADRPWRHEGDPALDRPARSTRAP